MMYLEHDKCIEASPNDSISDLAFSPIADFLSVSSWDRTVRIYAISAQSDNEKKYSFGNHQEPHDLSASMKAGYEHLQPVLSTTWTQDGLQVVSGGCDNFIKVYDITSGQSINIGCHEAPISSVKSITIHGVSVTISCSWDGTLTYWDHRQLQPAATIQLPGRAYSLDSKSNLLVVASSEQQISEIDLSNPTVISNNLKSPLKFQTTVVTCFPDGKGYIIGGIEGRCAVQYLKPKSSSSFTFKCHRTSSDTSPADTMIYSVNDVSFHPEYGTFLTAGSDGTVQIWDKDNQCRISQSTKLSGAISSAAFNQNGSILAYAVSYDWSKGYQFNTPDYPHIVKLQKVDHNSVKIKKK